jgi:hypothetical protein
MIGFFCITFAGDLNGVELPLPTAFPVVQKKRSSTLFMAVPECRAAGFESVCFLKKQHEM